MNGLVVPLMLLATGGAMTPSALEVGRTSISVTVDAQWVLSDVDELYGLDVWEDNGEVRIIFIDAPSGVMGSFWPDSGTVVGEVPLAPSNTVAWGVAFNNAPENELWHTNDWSATDLYYTNDLVTWETVANPAGSAGRGMDFDGTHYWETSGSSGVYRFQPGGTSELFLLPEVSSMLTGLAVFPLGDDLGVVVTCSGTLQFFFYVWNGSEMQFLGSVDCPAGPVSGFNNGLAYCSSEDALYWSFYAPARTLARLTFDIEAALDASTWGAVKGAFQTEPISDRGAREAPR